MTTTLTIKASCEMEIPFFDVDTYKIVWHGNYAKYFEIARCELLEKIGYPYSTMEESGYFFPVIDMQTRYVKPLVFKQKVIIIAELKEWENKLIINYLIKDRDSGQIFTKAQTTQVAVLMPEQITQFQSPAPLIESVNKLLAPKGG